MRMVFLLDLTNHFVGLNLRKFMLCKRASKDSIEGQQILQMLRRNVVSNPPNFRRFRLAKTKPFLLRKVDVMSQEFLQCLMR